MQTIYYHGKIVTMEENAAIQEAVAIENGKIIAVGSDEEILAMQKQDTLLVDLQGKTMLPGFIDGHSHFVGFANSLAQCDLSEAKSFEDIITFMQAFMQKHPISKGEWLIGCNYDHNFLKEQHHPTRDVLNQISKDIPILVIHASSHMGVANDAALKAGGIDENVTNPDGGRFTRDPKGQLTGYMEENAFIQFQGKVPMISFERLLNLIEEAQNIYASYGITTIQDGMVADDLFQLLQYVSSKNLLKQDIVAYIDINHCRSLLKNNFQYHHQYINHLKIGGYKAFLDGSPQARTAWMSEPYENSDDCGYPVLTDQRIYTLISETLEDRQQLLVHCNGDGAAEQYITQFEKVLKDKHLNETYRPVMVHAQLVRKDQLQRMQALKMMPSFFIAHTYFWGDIHLANFGWKRASHISPANTALHYQLPFTFHQDSPVLLPDMLRTVWCAVNRITKNGVILGEDERISIMEALKAITINGAYQYFEEDSKGTITKGKVADLVILDRNPLETPNLEIKDIQVLETIKDGKTIYKR